MSLLPTPDLFDLSIDTLIIGAGACGLTAALAAHEAGQSVLVLERDPRPAGSTALSAGLIPAAGTPQQAKAGIIDDPARFVDDIQAKARGENDLAHVTTLATQAAPTIQWLTDTHGLPFTVVKDFDYPGHSRRRMHGLPSRAGSDLIDALRATAEAQGIDIIGNRHVTGLFAQGARVTGARAMRPDGEPEDIGCVRLILASNGFGGDPILVARYMPQIKEALWFGHDGNTGDAIRWGTALGAEAQHLGAFQGHGNVAHPHGILITWATMTEGGIQVNRHGQRFWDESQGYSEAARAVMAQPGGAAWAIFDMRVAAIARQFADFQQAEAQGAIKSTETLADLAQQLGLPAQILEDTVVACHAGPDPFGRDFSPLQPLAPPFCGVRVTGALFHTQGGLRVDDRARVLRADGTPLPNLYAGGGAAVGVSGRSDSGYLSGNGLLAAVVLGHLAGQDWPDAANPLN